MSNLIDISEWFETIELGDIDKVEELLVDNEDLLQSRNPTSTPYDTAIAPFIIPLLGQDTTRMTALHFAIIHCADAELIEFLIDETAAEHIDATWGMGNTALHLASFLGETDYIPALLRAGANPHLSNALGKTPTDAACDAEVRQVFVSLGHVAPVASVQGADELAAPAKQDAARKAAADENRRKSLVAYKDRKSLGHAELKRLSIKPTEIRSSVTVAATAHVHDTIREDEGEQDTSFIKEMLDTSTVFGRRSFGVKEYMKIAASTPEEKSSFRDKRAQQELESETLRRQLNFSSTSDLNGHEKVVVHIQHSLTPESFDPMRSPEAHIGGVKTMTPELRRSPIKAPPSTTRPKAPRDSISTFIENLENSEKLSAPRTNATPKVFVKVLDVSELQVEGLKSDAKLYCVIQSDKQVRTTSVFKQTKTITLNEEFVMLSPEGSQVTVELRRKRSKNALKVMSVFSSVSSGSNSASLADPYLADIANDVLLAKFTITPSYLGRNCHNKLKKGVFVWQPAQSGTQITGIASLQIYRHADETAWVPRDIAECAELFKQRTHERTAKVWGEGYIHIGTNFLHWTRRYAKIQGGRMFTYEQETKDPREVLDFAGFEEISLMDTDECSVPHNFKVNTSHGHFYFYAESKRDKAKWVENILGMMSAIHSADFIEGELTRSSSIKSVKSTPSKSSTMSSSITTSIRA